MDTLYWDTFDVEADLCDIGISTVTPDVSYQVPCERCKNLESLCIRCKIRRQIYGRWGKMAQKAKISPLETAIANDTNHVRWSTTWLEGWTKITATPLEHRSDLPGEHVFIADSDKPRESGELAKADMVDPNLVWATDDFITPTRHIITSEELNEFFDNDETEGSNSEQAELQSASFAFVESPIIRLVWFDFLDQHVDTTQWERRRPLREAARMVFGPSFQRQTAHAVGVLANCDSPPLWRQIWHWLQRQGKML